MATKLKEILLMKTGLIHLFKLEPFKDVRRMYLNDY
jgi:hypothetical protein